MAPSAPDPAGGYASYVESPSYEWILWAFVGIIGVIFLAFGWLVYSVMHQENLDRKLALSAQYLPGQTVQTRVGHLRGTVVGVWCYKGACSFEVRFPVASMETKAMAAYEIEPSR